MKQFLFRQLQRKLKARGYTVVETRLLFAWSVLSCSGAMFARTAEDGACGSLA